MSSLPPAPKTTTLLASERRSVVAHHHTDVCAATTKETSFLLNKLIAHPMHGDEVRGLLRVLFQLVANVCDVGLHRV